MKKKLQNYIQPILSEILKMTKQKITSKSVTRLYIVDRANGYF